MTLNNKEQNFIFDSKQLTATFKPRKNDDEILRSNLLLGIGDYIRKSGFNNVVVGSSAGVDSATVLSLACDEIGPSNVYGLIMPSINNESKDAELARQLHTNLGCHTLEIPIDYEQLLNKLNESKIDKPYSDIADQNLQARLRDIYIMHFANAYNLLPLATGNKTESALGYYTLNDMNLGFDPISDLYKKDIYAVAKLDPRIPKEIIERKPTAALKKGQTDEQDLLPYPILDEIVYEFIENNVSLYTTFVNKRKINVAEKDYNRIIKLIYKNEFKRRQNCLGLKTTKKAFGSGRRYPVCQVI